MMHGLRRASLWPTPLSPLASALLVSVALHAAALSIRLPPPAPVDRLLKDAPLEVVLLNTRQRAQTPPERPQALAQTTLAGGGALAQGRARSPLPSTDLSQLGDGSDPLPKRLQTLQQQQALLLADVKRAIAQMPAPQDAPDPQARAQLEQKMRRMLKLLAEIEQRIQQENARPRKHYVSPATREVPYALYYDALKRRIEAHGTRHFPERQGQKLYGELTMVITVNSEGRVLTTEVVQGSGVADLDRRAQAIATAAGPFGRFTPAMRAQADQLAIVSRFVFSRDNALHTLGREGTP